MQATLNGVLLADGGETCEVSFEWGSNTYYGAETPKQRVTSGTSFSYTITGLGSGRLYHFRAKAVNSKGTVYGGDQFFTTQEEVGPIGLIDETLILLRIMGG